MKKILLILSAVIALTLIGLFLYSSIKTSQPTPTPIEATDPTFTPFGRVPTPVVNNGTTITQSTSTNNQNNAPLVLPTLRLLSNTPVGGYGASTTASTTVVRWVDRGRGNIYETRGDSSEVTTISNTVVPKIVDSIWNKNLTAFVSSTFSDSTLSNNAPQVSTLYAEIRARILPKTATSTLNATSSKKVASTTTTTSSAGVNGSALIQAPGTSMVVDTLQTPFELKGKNLPANIVTYASSPKKDKIFFMIDDGSKGVGYTATFDGKSVTQIFSTPVTEINAEWPEENTITLTTKGSASYGGFLYFVNPKTGIWKKVMGPIIGLSTRTSHDGKYVLASSAEKDSVSTAVYTLATQKYTSAVIRTLADKCVWGNFNQNMFYCAVPAQPISAVYPDDWYRGTVSGADKIWQVNASSGEIHLVTSIVDQSDRVIDAFNLGLDPKDEYLFFMNKTDLSLWSFDLVSNKVQ